jgi:hypothetical protein
LGLEPVDLTRELLEAFPIFLVFAACPVSLFILGERVAHSFDVKYILFISNTCALYLFPFSPVITIVFYKMITGKCYKQIT